MRQQRLLFQMIGGGGIQNVNPSKEEEGTEEMASQLRALAALEEDPGLACNTHMVTHNCL